MAAQQRERGSRAGVQSVEEANEVRLVGRVSAEPEARELPSGDVVWSLRVVVGRPPPARRRADAAVRREVDAIECSAWTARARRSVSSWQAGDVVEVHGRLRRRFYRSGAGAQSRVDVEMAGGRLIRRATTG